jgi:hypothetical protein
MPAVPITSKEQYIKAIEVLDRVGGTWSGVGFEERYLLVSERQFQALVEAGVAVPKDEKKDAKHGKKSPKRRQS